MGSCSTCRDLDVLVTELRAEPRETEWLEFKEGNRSPTEIGEYISALSNAAAYCRKPFGYLVWGIEDASHGGVGTAFNPLDFKVGNQPLQLWLSRLVSPSLDFEFGEAFCEGKRVAVLKVPAARTTPVRFQADGAS